MNYVTIRVSTLRGDQKINFDVYVKINEKMILYLKKGDSFEGDRLQRLKAKNLRKMFINSEEELNYLKYLKTNIDSAYDLKTSTSRQNRAEIIQGVQQSCAEDIMDNPADVNSYHNAKVEIEKYVQFLMKDDQSVNDILNIENTNQNLAQHGVSVSTLAISLAHRLGLTDSKKLQLMGLGALIHDFGHTFNEIDLTLPIKEMTPEAYAIWRNHADLGARKVQDKGHFDPTVLKIMLQHEEKCDGSGPLGLIEKNQEPLATLVASANTTDRLLSFQKIQRKDAPQNLILNYLGQHPLEHIKILSDIIKS